MRPTPLLSLRCPNRCLLGQVVATNDGLQLVLRRRTLVQVDADRARREEQWAGPFPLDAPGFEDVGCRHLTGETLDDGHLARIRAAVDQVRRGTPGAPRDLTVSSAVQ